ncbi:MAG: arginine--tRNA ligase [Firmicutes bacterium]|nr:arginine--tRNA ligase [Bacillota bacterium]
MNYKQHIVKKIKMEGFSFDEILSNIVSASEATHGDYSLPCFSFAKALKKSPIVIANEIKESFTLDKYIQRVEVIAGYVNFFLERKSFIESFLTEYNKNGAPFASLKANNKTICIDYSSINIAKPFHIGHLLTTAIGGSLYRIFSHLGYTVVGINHLGDYGTQFGKLISAYKRWGDKKQVEEGGITALTTLYVRFHDEAKNDKSLEDEARKYFLDIENGNKEAMELFNWFKELTMLEVEKVYKRLGVVFDSYDGEAFYNDKMQPVIDVLNEKNLLTVSEGAKVVDLEQFDMPPCLILKSDGASLYATRDLAAAMYRKNKYNFDKNLYVVAYQQNLHFKQVFQTLELMGYDWAPDCVHVPFGMVSLEGGLSMSTREGRVVYLSDVLQTAVDKTLTIIKEKNPTLGQEEKALIAEKVGVGAVVFMALSSSKIKDLVFSYDRALNFDGETAPYIQYTHTRCRSILAKSSGVATAETDKLTDDDSFAIIKMLSKFDDIVTTSAIKYEPSILAKYLIDICQLFNKYYSNHKILGDSSREALTSIVALALKKGLSLLLIDAPDRM